MNPRQYVRTALLMLILPALLASCNVLDDLDKLAKEDALDIPKLLARIPDAAGQIPDLDSYKAARATLLAEDTGAASQLNEPNQPIDPENADEAKKNMEANLQFVNTILENWIYGNEKEIAKLDVVMDGKVHSIPYAGTQATYSYSETGDVREFRLIDTEKQVFGATWKNTEAVKYVAAYWNGGVVNVRVSVYEDSYGYAIRAVRKFRNDGKSPKDDKGDDTQDFRAIDYVQVDYVKEGESGKLTYWQQAEQPSTNHKSSPIKFTLDYAGNDGAGKLTLPTEMKSKAEEMFKDAEDQKEKDPAQNKVEDLKLPPPMERDNNKVVSKKTPKTPVQVPAKGSTPTVGKP